MALLLVLFLILAVSCRNDAKNSVNPQDEDYYSSDFRIDKGINLELFLGSSVVALEIVPKAKSAPVEFGWGIVSPDGKRILALYSVIESYDDGMNEDIGVDVFYGNYLLKPVPNDKLEEADISLFEIPASAELKSQVKFGDSDKLEHLDSIIMSARIIPGVFDDFHTKTTTKFSRVSIIDASDFGWLENEVFLITVKTMDREQEYFYGAPIFAIGSGSDVPELVGISWGGSVVLRINRILDLVKQETEIDLRNKGGEDEE